MKNRWLLLSLFVVLTVGFPFRSPAPLVFKSGEGWSYEPQGAVGKWQRARAKDQLEVAQKAFADKDYDLTIKAAKRTVDQWPLSDFAPDAQYLLGRAYEEKGNDEKAFKSYQKVLEKYPKIANYQEVLQRQFEISNKYLAGKWFRLWGTIPLYPSMERTADMYEKVIKNGPYSDVAAQAQMNIGAAREKQRDFFLAVRAYERAADRYNDRPEVAADALYKAGQAYTRQAKTSEYDQNVAAQAIATYTDFMTLYPNDPRVKEVKETIQNLKTEQARGNYNIARYYQKHKKLEGALIYYNEVLLKDPASKYAEDARKQIEVLKEQTEKRTAQN